MKVIFCYEKVIVKSLHKNRLWKKVIVKMKNEKSIFFFLPDESQTKKQTTDADMDDDD